MRVFTPSLKAADFKGNRERFEGYGLALAARAVEEAGKLDITNIPNDPKFAGLKKQIQTIATVGAAKVQKALQAVTTLPLDGAGEVFAAYAEGVKKDTFRYAMNRFRDNQTVQICVFLILARPWIESRKVGSVSALFEVFMKIKEAFPGQKQFFDAHPRARQSLEAQFRNICSEDDLKIRGRGRPRKIQSAKL
jgi:hypothetical protein